MFIGWGVGCVIRKMGHSEAYLHYLFYFIKRSKRVVLITNFDFVLCEFEKGEGIETLPAGSTPVFQVA